MPRGTTQHGVLREVTALAPEIGSTRRSPGHFYRAGRREYQKHLLNKIQTQHRLHIWHTRKGHGGELKKSKEFPAKEMRANNSLRYSMRWPFFWVNHYTVEDRSCFVSNKAPAGNDETTEGYMPPQLIASRVAQSQGRDVSKSLEHRRQLGGAKETSEWNLIKQETLRSRTRLPQRQSSCQQLHQIE